MDVTTSDGRTLHVVEAGVPDGPAIVWHHGTPDSGGIYRHARESAEQRGLRLLAYDRPGYGGSTPHPGRTVADAASDVGAILDELGVERFATYGLSGGGPHALACAALLPDRCAAAVSVAGVGPADAPDLDWMAGMGEGNEAEFGAARDGRERLTEFCAEQAEAILAAGQDQFVESLRPHLSDVDAEMLTSDYGAFLWTTLSAAIEHGVEGWVDDDYAFLAPWGFDVEAMRVPVLVWQGVQDLMVPAAHGSWLGEHVAGAEVRIFPDEGHLTMASRRVGELHDWLKDHLTAGTPSPRA